MATEGPLLHDGSHTVAYANYYNPSSALAGPGGSAQFCAMGMQAPRIVQLSTTVGGLCYGVLQNMPGSAEPADIGFVGVSKIVAGASVTMGAEIMCDASGRAITWVAGSGYYKMGLALETVAAAQSLFTVYLYTPSQGIT